MRRRDFITLIGGAAATWPLTTRAQQMRRIGMLLAFSESDLEGQARVATFQKCLQELGWTDGRNVRIDYRLAVADADRVRYAAELVAIAPDVILATTGATVGVLEQASRTVPLVLVTVLSSVGGG